MNKRITKQAVLNTSQSGVGRHNNYTRLNEISALLVQSNKVAKHASYEIVGKRKYLLFREALKGKVTLPERTMKIITMLPEEDKEVMLAAEGVIDELTYQFMPLLRKMTSHCAETHSGFKSAELLGVAWLALRQAVFGYDDPNYKLITYIYKCVHRELVRHCLENRNDGVGSHSSEYIELFQACYKAKNMLYHRLEREPKPEDIYEEVRKEFPDALDLRHKISSLMRRCLSGDELFIKGNTNRRDSDFSEAVADKSSLVDKQLLNAQSEGVEGLLNRAEIFGVAKAVLLAKANDEPVKVIAKRYKVSQSKIKAMLVHSRKKIRELKKIA